MAYKDLLVVLDADPPSRDRIVVAAALAERFGAHLVGLYVTPAAEPPGRLDYFNSDLPLFGPLYRDIEEERPRPGGTDAHSFRRYRRPAVAVGGMAGGERISRGGGGGARPVRRSDHRRAT